jgi:hypothetical protein
MIKITANLNGKIHKFDAKEFCGYIICERLNKVYPISNEAVPLIIKGRESFLCYCSRWIHEDMFYHKLTYKGKNVYVDFE